MTLQDQGYTVCHLLCTYSARLVSQIVFSNVIMREVPLRTLLILLVAGTCAFAQTYGRAKVMSMSGQVSVMRDNGLWALNPNDTIAPQQTIRTGPDGYAVFRTADGSTFDVYPNSQVIFRNNPGDWKDMLDVILGKIKVTIEHFGSVPNHNTVRTPTAVIAVRGTIFDVSVEDDQDTTLVLCEEGRVEVYHSLQPGKSKFLDPGESVRVFKNQPLAKTLVDHGDIAQRAFRAATDALNQILYRRATGSGTASTGSTSPANGDKGGTPPPTGTGPTATPPPGK